MRLAAGGEPVAVKRRAVNRSTKVKTSLLYELMNSTVSDRKNIYEYKP
jgi:hypothetical protein